MRGKKRFYKWIELLAAIGIVCLIHGMAITGALYYTDIYDRCYEWDKEMISESYSMEELEAEFYNFRMMIYSGEDVSEALVSMKASGHTNEIGRKLHGIYKTGRMILWIGLLLCILAFFILRRRKRYKVLKKGVTAAFVIPVIFTIAMLVVRFTAMRNVLECIWFSRYEKVFYDDPAFVSILPRGIFLGYFLNYLIVWLVASVVFLCVYYTKKKHRRPYEF